MRKLYKDVPFDCASITLTNFSGVEGLSVLLFVILGRLFVKVVILLKLISSTAKKYMTGVGFDTKVNNTK